MNDVRELLERAAEDAGRPTVSTEAVYVRAARLRFRRRAAVSAAALAVVAAGAVGLPRVTGGTGAEQSSVAAERAGRAGETGTSGRAGRVEALLPPGTGSVEQVSLAVLIKNATPEQAETTYAGPLDGEYMIRADGGVGYLVVRFMDSAAAGRKLGGAPQDDICVRRGKEPPVTGCVREELPDGGVLTTWSDAMEYGDGGTPRWGPETVGRLRLEDGSLLGVRASSGYLGERSQGPLLKSPPLGQDALRALMRRPELLPGA
ncbi:hypothetical protein CP967_10635 [Streptomyces nitrosporeus]|uniref:Uncharacterized protein n=1 Tax=Streptomyces nitrosporeus TaxID=28894 RepID=A0A5J6F7P6_9ACTN|nr:hypothetical protein [Streptomyces nitrosporeus]QEU72388.1 hypothetical protein CP967_10635 [Streptomyces nitrosporeus]GGY78356.1 hypothetical protein GCM10010327_05720 [Streptomyces nitrosporeus]